MYFATNHSQKRWHKLVLLMLVSLLLTTCGTQARTAPTTLTVFAAASLSDVFTELGTQFEASHAGVKVTFNFAGSDQLAQQIVQGAAADIFASANTKQMSVVVQAGEVAQGSEQVFAHNRLVLVYPQSNPAHLQSLADLSRPGVKIVLANKSVPAGAYALKVLDQAAQLPEYTASYSATVLSNVVSYEQNVRAVLSKVMLGEADAGIVYMTDAASVKDGSIGTLVIPDQLQTAVDYVIAVTKGAQHAQQAQAFVAYLLSAEGQGILQKYGFLTRKQ